MSLAPSPLRLTISPSLGLLVVLGILGLALWQAAPGDQVGDRLALTVLYGAALGYLFHKTRFCLFCMARDGIQGGDTRPIRAVLATLALGTIGYAMVFGAWLPDPSAGWLPPNAFIGPVGWHLVAGGILFGLGMALSGSCISSHLYRLGEGHSTGLLALAGAVGGFLLAYLSWDFWYLGVIQEAPVVWLPATLGYPGAAALQLAILGGLAWKAARKHRLAPAKVLHQEVATPGEGIRRLLRSPWPLAAGALGVALIGTLAYFRVRPLGVTSELSRLARAGGQGMGLLDVRPIRGLDVLAGCTPQEVAEFLSQNGWFILALVGGSLGASLLAGRFKLRLPGPAEAGRALVGGLMLGYGAMISLGCSMGTFLSGTMAMSLSGWVFGAAMFGGLWLGIKALARQGIQTGCAAPVHPGNVGGATAVAPGPRGGDVPGFVSPRDLAAIPERDLVIDVGRSYEDYLQGHIPGAQWLDFSRVYTPSETAEGGFPLPFHQVLDAALRGLPVILYDGADGQRAARTAVALILGGWSGVRILDGGLDAWVGSGLPLARGWEAPGKALKAARAEVAPEEPVSSPAVGLAEGPAPRIGLIDARTLEKHREQWRLIDTRTRDEFSGALVRTQRGGHIPGALHLDWRESLGEGLQLRPREELEALWMPLLATEGPTVLYCHSGLRASHPTFLLAALFPDKEFLLFDGSWRAWDRGGYAVDRGE